MTDKLSAQDRLVAFFRSEIGRDLGAYGDWNGLDTVDAAIHFLTRYAIHLKRESLTTQAEFHRQKIAEIDRELNALEEPIHV